jgi:hypothetical protein
MNQTTAKNNNHDVAILDKQVLDLKERLNFKKQILRENYQQCLESIKENPYLKHAAEEYEAQFAIINAPRAKQIEALTTLLECVEKSSERKNIKNEIKKIQKGMM